MTLVSTETEPTRHPAPQASLAVTEEEANPHEVAEQLHRLLANTYRVYNSTQMAHWNVEGPHFASLHAMFEDQYEKLAEAIDRIAERIRAIGFFVNGGLSHLAEFSAPQPVVVTGSPERLMSDLLRQHQHTITELRLMLRTAQDARDDVTADMLIDRMTWHEDAVWTLRSTLGKRSSSIRPTPGFQQGNKQP